MTKLTLYLAMMVFSSNFSSTTAVKDRPAEIQTAQQTMQLADEEQRFIDLINSERYARGLNTLALDPTLVETAREHSKEMCDKDYFDHYSPTPEKRTARERFLLKTDKRPIWALIGENLFYCSITDVNRGHTCLMESPGHRENILNSKFDRVGVGVYKSEDGQFWVTEMFLTRID